MTAAFAKALRGSERLAKKRDDLLQVMRSYGVDPARPDCWFRFCVVLFEKCKERKPGKAGRRKGNAPEWPADRRRKLVAAMDLKRQGGKLSARAAARFLSSDWDDWTRAELAARYSEFKSEADTFRLAAKATRKIEKLAAAERARSVRKSKNDFRKKSLRTEIEKI